MVYLQGCWKWHGVVTFNQVRRVDAVGSHYSNTTATRGHDRRNQIPFTKIKFSFFPATVKLWPNLVVHLDS